MGTSNWQNISYCVNLIRKINPESILDIGAGFGRWGILCREFLEVWDGGNYSGKWDRKINAVEIFDNYLKPYHNYFYNNIYKQNATDYFKENKEQYDLIIFGDVIEHFEKQVAEKLIEDSLAVSKYILINIPIGKNWEQGIENDNIYETHKSVWYYSDFRKYKNYKIKKFKDYTYRKFGVILISKSKINLNSEYKKKYGKYFFIKKLYVE